MGDATAPGVSTLPGSGPGSQDSFHAQVTTGGVSRLGDETQQLLRVRLKAAGLLLATVLVFSFLRNLFISETPPLRGVLLLVAFLVAMTLYLRSDAEISFRALRVFDLLMVFSVAAFVTVSQYKVLSAGIARGAVDKVSNQLEQGLLTFVFLILVYSIFIPNTWKRAVLAIAPVALMPLVLRIALTVQSPALRDLVDFDRASYTALVLGATVGAALFGAHVINSLRVEAFEARQLGQYTLEEKIGSGGMGEVWKASHRMLARPAAVKLIRPEMLGAQDAKMEATILKRFEREAQETAALTSPHSILIYDFGISTKGVFYYVMELLDGMDMGSLVERFGPVSPERAVWLLKQACESLADAHYRGLVHRDIKPANLFVCRMGRVHDFVKILDFGLVKTPADVQSDATALTQAGLTTGTPAFMAPEQALGDTVSARTDIYALGCVAYWLLTGCLVFDSKNATAMVVDHVKTEPTPPSKRVELDVPEDLEEVILACLKKSPEDRPASAEELAAMLGSCEQSGTRWGDAEAARWWGMHS